MTMTLLLLIFAVDVDALAKTPGMAKVERVVPGEQLIIHVLDWHYVSKEPWRKRKGSKATSLS